jgi:oligopeptide/dipeptide ABC transporter ATP-binding protein
MPLVEARDLAVEYRSRGRVTRALDGVDLQFESGTTVGIVGESGSGKSTLGLAVGRLLPGNARRVAGDLLLDGRSVFDLTDDELIQLRQNALGFVFQNPMSALDPTMRIGHQVADVLPDRSRESINRLLARVGLPDGDRVAASYPHQLSGGMAQRVAIGVAIARQPRLIVADEPTASLDASVREQILDLLVALPKTIGATVLLLSHDLKAVATRCSRVIVMYGGRAVEAGPSDLIFQRPSHPYSIALLRAAPGTEGHGGQLHAIRGMHPVLSGRSSQCTFVPRCDWAADVCSAVRPESRSVAHRDVICHRAEEVVANVHR